MKKILLKLLILLYLPIIGFSQEKSFDLGLLYGASLNSLSGLDSRDALTNNLTYKKYPRPLGGLLAEYNFTNLFSIKSKLLYHIKGGGNSDNLTSSDNTLTDFHYATLPFLSQFNFGENKWRLFCNTGFYLGYLIKQESFYVETEEQNEQIQQSDNFNKFDFGLMLGYGISFQISNRIGVFLESSLDYGITNSAKMELIDDDVMLIKSMTGVVGLTYGVWSSKKKTFNGTDVLDCTDYNESLDSKQKKKTKWRLVLYKDGEKIGKKSKKGKSKLFKRKN